MPTYDYHCIANNRTIEVIHKISENLTTWGELCTHIGINIGDTPKDTPIQRLANGGNIISSKNLGSGKAPKCSTGSCCAGGICGL